MPSYPTVPVGPNSVSSQDIVLGHTPGNTTKSGVPIPGESQTTYYNPGETRVPPSPLDDLKRMSCSTPETDFLEGV